MPRKKKIKDEDLNELSLTREELLEYELLSTRLEMNLAQVERWKANEALKKIEMEQQIGFIRARKLENKRSADNVIDDRTKLVRKIEDRLGVNLKNYTIMVGGTLRLIEEEKNEGAQEEQKGEEGGQEEKKE